MYILGIESSCDETAAAVVKDGRELCANCIETQMEEHRLYGGVVPEIASRRHCESIVGLTDAALKEAGLTLEQIDGIAVTYGPGLIGALLVGVNFAKGLCMAAGKPLIPVHHLRGHIAANYLVHPVKPPFLCMVLSGGHSHIIEVKDYTKFEMIGRTRDDAVGEAYDKVARVLGFPYPGGVAMDKAAQQGHTMAYKLPKPVVQGHPYDFSFSGLKTAVMNLVNRASQKGEELEIHELAYSFQQTVCDIIAPRLMAAMEETGYQTLVLAGGVSANSGIRKRIQKECDQRGYTLYMPPLSLCGDNAAMIAAQGYYEAQAGNFAGMDLNAAASIPITHERTVSF